MIILLLVAIFSYRISGIDITINIDRVMDHINEYRRLHQAPKLVYSTKISIVSQNWTDYMANEQVFRHSDSMYGENLAMMPSNGTESLIQSIDMFYSEVVNYDYYNPGYTTDTGHFTQLVWINSKEIGLGITTSINRYTYICTNFNPPGNYQNDFLNNVKPIILPPIYTYPRPTPMRVAPKTLLIVPPSSLQLSVQLSPALSPPHAQPPPDPSEYSLIIKYPFKNITHIDSVLCPTINHIFNTTCRVQSISSVGIYYGALINMEYKLLRQMIADDIDDFTQSCKIVCGSTITVYLNGNDLFRYTASKSTCL